MDKIDSETWEEYAFRNNLFVIKYVKKVRKYVDKENKILEERIIDDITIPIHTNLKPRNYDANGYNTSITIYGNEISNIGFMDFIMYELYNLRTRYNLGCFSDRITTFKLEEREEDINRQDWLFKQLAYWEKKYVDNEREKKETNEKRLVDTKTRYFELKTTISETHKEQLDELLAIVRYSSIPVLEGELKVKGNIYSEEYWLEKKKKEEEKEKEKQTKKKERVELYQKYLKNKDIQTQIMELEQKINQLKGEIVN
uniref:Uncharacterized protein n=1 Tax=viral metagenome TaxID=1070528 RepID=A0A6C0HGK1_9ZZZZ